MDHKLTQRLGAWLTSKPEDRDFEEGALLLLKLSGNRVEYSNLTRNPGANMEYLEARLQKYYDYRVAALTHDQVATMTKQAETAVKTHLGEGGDTEKAGLGKRPDHDSLPEEIQACWVENADLLRRMRSVHERLKGLTLTDAPCPDSDRYPYVKELCELDKKLRANYDRYDRWGMD